MTNGVNREAAVSAPAPAPADSGLERCIDWLTLIAERRDLGLPPPPDARAASIIPLLECLSAEFAGYREVVTGAREAARRNAELLYAVVASTGEAGMLVRATAAAATDAGRGAAHMCAAAEALRGFAQSAGTAAGGAGTDLAAIDAALAELARRLGEGDGPLLDMRRSTGGVGEFLLTLARLSRHAQLLSVNASIEAAHLAEAGSRFAIVATEVRKLSVSTRDSKAGVAKIVGELRESTEHVAAATKESKAATSAAASEIAGAGDALAHTGRGIVEFEAMVATVADVAATQSMALEAISSSVDQLSRHADKAAVASRDATQLDLDALLERAQNAASRWQLRQRSAPAPDAEDVLGIWVQSLTTGAHPLARAPIDAHAALRPLVGAVRELLERVNSDQREVLGDVVHVAVAVSRNGFAWRSIAQSLDGVNHEIQIVRETVAESVSGARTSAELANGMQTLVNAIRSQFNAALQLLEGALSRVSSITASVRDIDGFVESTSSAATRADQIVALIETLSSETDLLSLNAAIEAAHAGELGRGFSVIAEEIRSLARSTNESTISVSHLVADITRIGGRLAASIGGAATSMDAVVTGADGVRGAIAALQASFESAMESALGVAATATDQTRALDRVLANINRSNAGVTVDVTARTDRSRLELAMVGSRAHAIAARRPIGTVVERIRVLTEGLCVRLEDALESCIAHGAVAADALFDLRYEPIEGAAIASLGRLFDVSKVPNIGFTPTKYATPWDGRIDEALIDVLTDVWREATTTAPLIAMFVSDLNGLLYAYPRQRIAAWTNDPATDNAGNRIKRMFEDEYSLRVVRWGLGPHVADLSPRCDYERFRAAGCQLRQTAERPWGGYVYSRDTNVVCNEVVMALYIRGMRHGTVRVCYDANLI